MTGCFPVKAETLRLPDDYDQGKGEHDSVDSSQFWSDVELLWWHIVPLEYKISEFETKPDILKLAPYIGKRTRARNLLLNTDQRKIGGW